ncbi:hypothetical protein COLO4_01491, partial [Corchorus olitorius]
KKVTASSKLTKAATYLYISPQFNPKVSKRLKKVKLSNSTSLKAHVDLKQLT